MIMAACVRRGKGKVGAIGIACGVWVAPPPEISIAYGVTIAIAVVTGSGIIARVIIAPPSAPVMKMKAR